MLISLYDIIFDKDALINGVIIDSELPRLAFKS